ncbi:MAG: iron ABC transporter permease, partial [Coriobacteriales bacterium]|nr:iron ABC transporter permease [Coriobacteriales bacterium]
MPLKEESKNKQVDEATLQSRSKKARALEDSLHPHAHLSDAELKLFIDRMPKSRQKKKAGTILIILGVLLIVVACVSLMLGRYPISPIDAVLMLLYSAGLPIEPTWTTQAYSLFMNVRLPRILMAGLVGCCLSAAGAAYQGTFQNPLVSPDILGASQGAALGAAIGILLHAGALGIQSLAFVFSVIAVTLVLIIGSRAKGNHILVVVLAGVMISSLFSAGVSYCKLVADPSNELADITYWLMGSVTGSSLDQLFGFTEDHPIGVFPIMVIGLVALFVMRWRINILTMGDEEAQTMGVNVRRLRILIILAATLVTAASVSVTGMIGWVGLVIPHLCRMLIGVDYRKLIPASMLMGASFLLIVDDFSR